MHKSVEKGALRSGNCSSSVINICFQINLRCIYQYIFYVPVTGRGAMND